jgi:uncharacterized protein (TIGR00661 family)
VRYGRTFTKNLITAPEARRSFSRLSELADQWQIQLVCTDFEPLSCYLGHRRKLPVISIDNQHCLINAEITYPRQYRREAAAAKLVTRLMTPRADAYLVISFFDAPARDPHTFLFPPILRSEILQARPTHGEHVLVYVTSPASAMAELLRKVNCRFVCYGFNRDGEEGNIVFKKPSLDGFLQDLIGCKAIVANAGFSLVSEALHLGKPYLAIPVKKQFEQVFNAYYVDKMKYGVYWGELNKERIEAFLFNLDAYRAALANYPRAGNAALLRKLDELIYEYVPAATKAATASVL